MPESHRPWPFCFLPTSCGLCRFWGEGMRQEEDLATAAAAAGVAKSAPPVVVSGMTLAGYPLNDWVLVATLLWIVVQMGWFIWSNIIKPRRRPGGDQ
ncbi:hypothetical protein ACSZNU_17895 [Aeromonas hydrophila]